MRHETAAHRAAERETALRFCALLPGTTPRKREDEIDWDLLDERGRVRAFFEVKNRTCPSRQFRTCVCDLTKVRFAEKLAKATKKRVLYVVRWTDGMGVLDINLASYKVGSMTLRNPRDQYDKNDPVAEFAINQFRIW